MKMQVSTFRRLAAAGLAALAIFGVSASSAAAARYVLGGTTCTTGLPTALPSIWADNIYSDLRDYEWVWVSQNLRRWDGRSWIYFGSTDTWDGLAYDDRRAEVFTNHRTGQRLWVGARLTWRITQPGYYRVETQMITENRFGQTNITNVYERTNTSTGYCRVG